MPLHRDSALRPTSDDAEPGGHARRDIAPNGDGPSASAATERAPADPASPHRIGQLGQSGGVCAAPLHRGIDIEVFVVGAQPPTRPSQRPRVMNPRRSVPTATPRIALGF